MANKEGYVKFTPLELRPLPCGELHPFVSVKCGDEKTKYLCLYCRGRTQGREEGRRELDATYVTQLHDEGRLEAAKEIKDKIIYNANERRMYFKLPPFTNAEFNGIIKGNVNDDNDLVMLYKWIEKEFGVGK